MKNYVFYNFVPILIIASGVVLAAGEKQKLDAAAKSFNYLKDIAIARWQTGRTASSMVKKEVDFQHSVLEAYRRRSGIDHAENKCFGERFGSHGEFSQKISRIRDVLLKNCAYGDEEDFYNGGGYPGLHPDSTVSKSLGHHPKPNSCVASILRRGSYAQETRRFIDLVRESGFSPSGGGKIDQITKHFDSSQAEVVQRIFLTP